MAGQADHNPFLYSDSNKRYHTYDFAMRRRFGKKCAKLPVDGGFTCPNRDGTKGTGGCIYCSARGSGDFCAGAELSVTEQLKRAYEAMSRKWDDVLGVAYFQAFTNTYAPLDVLRAKYEEALTFPNVVGLSVATRADCLPDDVCAYLAGLAERTFLTVELGLQTARDDTAERIGRGHTFADFLAGYEKLRRASPKIGVCVHLIDGLPGESREDMLETARLVGLLRPEQVKIHLLHVLEGTRLAGLWREGKVPMLSMEEYCSAVVGQLERLPPETVIGRVTGDGMADALLAPDWSRKKRVVMNTIDRMFYAQDTMQGRLFTESGR